MTDPIKRVHKGYLVREPSETPQPEAVPLHQSSRDARARIFEGAFDATLDDVTHYVFDNFYPILGLPKGGEAKTALLYRINDAIGAIMREYKTPQPQE